HLQAEDEADVVETDLGHEALEAVASFGRRRTAALVFIDDEDAVGGPAEVHRPAGESVLSLRGLGVLANLLGRGLSHVDDGKAVEVTGLDLRGALRHDSRTSLGLRSHREARLPRRLRSCRRRFTRKTAATASTSDRRSRQLSAAGKGCAAASAPATSPSSSRSPYRRAITASRSPWEI